MRTFERNSRFRGLVLIEIEGTDASGKETVAHGLVDSLNSRGYDAIYIGFPQYGNPSAAAIQQYLGGEYGLDPSAVNPYAASTFYAIDRFNLFFSKNSPLGLDRCSGTKVVVADRYVFSNAIHQASKLPVEQQEGFVDWLCDLEFGHFELPYPNIVFFLQAQPAVVKRALESRSGKPGVSNDIHEHNEMYLLQSRFTGIEMAKRLGWKVVSVTNSEGFLPKEEILSTVLEQVLPVIQHSVTFGSSSQNSVSGGF